MKSERTVAALAGYPFPIYPDLVDILAAAHLTPPLRRDETVAHVLGTCAAYAYGDTETVSTIMARLGFEEHACVRVAQTVDAMYIASTAYLVQSRCGRVVILSYRGTEPSALSAWLGDAEVGAESHALLLADGAGKVRVHAGFHQNVRATWWAVLRELTAALEGKCLANQNTSVEHRLEALYVTGHSLGGAMALLFALKVFGDSAQRSIAERLRAVYTFGQPMALVGPLPQAVRAIDSRLFRHVIASDPVPSLPPGPWGAFTHTGQEFRYADGQWQRTESPVPQLASLKELRHSVLGFLAPEKRRSSLRYRFDEHVPHHYLAALRPKDRLTEFGDWEG